MVFEKWEPPSQNGICSRGVYASARFGSRFPRWRTTRFIGLKEAKEAVEAIGDSHGVGAAGVGCAIAPLLVAVVVAGSGLALLAG